MRILVTGGTGQVGIELQRLRWPDGVQIDAPAREGLDLCEPETVSAYLARHEIAAVIHCAAYTAVDKAESEIAAAWRVNALVPAALAQATRAANVAIVHVSTDYVFDGSKNTPYETHDAVRPLGVYGASKEGGEQAIRTGNPRHVIVRTSWVVSAHRANFVKTMLRLAVERPVLRVVADQQGRLTSAADLAAALQLIALRHARDAAAPRGTWHFANAGECVWADISAAIMADNARRGKPAARIERISTSEYPTPARRPANSRLSTASLEADWGIVPRDWRVALRDILDELAA